MTSTERMSLLVAILAIVGGTVTTVLSGKYQMETARAQIQKDVRLVQIQALDKKEQILREKFEALIVEMSDLISFMNTNTAFPVALGKANLAKCRKAAFALSAHAGTSLSHAALSVVESTNWMFVPSIKDIAVVAGVDKSLAKSAAKLTEEFEKEVSQIAAQRRDLLGAL